MTPEVRTQLTNLDPIARLYHRRLQAEAIRLCDGRGITSANWSKARDTMKEISVDDVNGGTIKPFEKLRVLLKGEGAEDWAETQSVEIDDIPDDEADTVPRFSATGYH